jgi:hypothetical protein
MTHEGVTLLMTLTTEERETLERMRSRPQEVGASEGPLRIEAIRDVDTNPQGHVVQVDVVGGDGSEDPGDILELRLRRWMEEINASGTLP